MKAVKMLKEFPSSGPRGTMLVRVTDKKKYIYIKKKNLQSLISPQLCLCPNADLPPLKKAKKQQQNNNQQLAHITWLILRSTAMCSE